jgi:hypothetical protein
VQAIHTDACSPKSDRSAVQEYDARSVRVPLDVFRKLSGDVLIPISKIMMILPSNAMRVACS